MSNALHVERAPGAAAGKLPIVMLHGWGMNLRAFDALRADLPDSNTWAIDLPGHGRSPWWPGAATFEGQRDAVMAVLPARAVLVGWSFGAKLALSIAAEHADRVAGLLLIAATPKHLQSQDWPQGMAPAALRAFRSALEQDWQQTLEDFVALQLRGSSDADVARRTLIAVLADHGAPQPEALRAGLALLGTIDLRDAAARIDVPALLVTGANDRVTPPAAARWLVQSMRAAELLEIPRAGHAPLVSHHAQVAAALRELMTRVESGVTA